MAGLMVAIANSISSNYVVSAGGGFDPDAEAFIIATGISGGDATAINELVLDLKGANIWTKFNALYPIIGTTATQQKFNLKNPLDTNAAFRLSFSGGWTHSATGATPNGVNAYANTFLTPSTTLSQNNTHLSYYSRTNSNGTEVEMGATTVGNPPASILEIRTSGVTYLNLSANAYINYADANSQGFYIGTRTASNVIKLFKNSSIVSSGATVSTGQANSSLVLGAQNNGGGTIYFTTKQCAFSSIGSGLTDTESQLFYQIVEKYQVALGRNINPLQSFYYNRNYNNETNAYLFSTQITNTTEQTALDTFVTSMKGYGIWSKMKAVYPIMGTTATQQKFNLVNPQDTNSAYRLTFAGGWTHSSSGMTPNGTNAYADTNLLPSTSLTLNSIHLSYYSRTNISENSLVMGCWDGGGFNYTFLSIRRSTLSNNSYSALQQTAVSDNPTFLDSDSLGFYLSARTANNLSKIYKNGILKDSGADLSNANPSTRNIYLGASNGNTLNYSTKQCAFASIGDGLTDTEASNFYTAVQNFQTALGRAILPTPPIVSDPDAQAFINSANIVDQVEATAVNNLVIGLKADGLWTPMKAIYPMLGGSSSSNAVNLKTPGTFNLTFFGGWSHSSLGATPNGSNAYASTSLNPSINLVNNSTHISFYSRTDIAQSSVDWGVTRGSSPYDRIVLWTKWIDNNLYSDQYNDSTNRISYANSASTGFYVSSRTTSTLFKVHKNGSVVGTNTNSSVNNTPNGALILSALNTEGLSISLYSTRQCAFASVGDGLTDTQSSDLRTRVQAFNTALNRQV